MRSLFAILVAASVLLGAEHASAQSEVPSAASPGASDVDDLERLHWQTIHTRRLLADAVLGAGLVSIAGGGVLLVPNADDQAWRFAGVNTAIFGVVNTVVGLLALHGIGAEERSWESDSARAARRTPQGLARAKIHAAEDERRESVGHAISLGLDGAYLGVGCTAILASQLGVEHPNRWLASGAAIAFQAVFLIGVDLIGLTRSRAFHRAFVESLAPTFAFAPAAAGTDMQFGITGAF
ncbi:hypothetical protein BH09MYX1_BH09MYX1_41300 [soil metagenome]